MGFIQRYFKLLTAETLKTEPSPSGTKKTFFEILLCFRVLNSDGRRVG